MVLRRYEILACPKALLRLG